jgi:hypothetical protein
MLATAADVRDHGRGSGCQGSSGGDSQCDPPKAKRPVEDKPQSEDQEQHTGHTVLEALGQPLAQQRAHRDLGRGEFEKPYAASSMAKMAVSGWLIGSTPTRLTIDVTVPSASASTHAARCSRPR